jgi:hypothetical protein
MKLSAKWKELCELVTYRMEQRKLQQDHEDPFVCVSVMGHGHGKSWQQYQQPVQQTKSLDQTLLTGTMAF